MKSVRSQLHPLFGKKWRKIHVSDKIFGRIRYQFSMQPSLQAGEFIEADLIQQLKAEA